MEKDMNGNDSLLYGNSTSIVEDISTTNVTTTNVTTTNVTTTNGTTTNGTTSYGTTSYGTTSYGTTSYDTTSCTTWAIELTKTDMFRNQIRRQLASNVISRSAKFWSQHHQESEQRARELLRSLITPKEYREYLKKGFIVIQGPSGMIYQIFGGNKMIRSFIKDKSGKLIQHENICIVFSDPYDNLPYTDWVIMRKMIVENDEFGMRKIANIFKKKTDYIAEAS
jgi:hypothetical protein